MVSPVTPTPLTMSIPITIITIPHTIISTFLITHTLTIFIVSMQQQHVSLSFLPLIPLSGGKVTINENLFSLVQGKISSATSFPLPGKVLTLSSGENVQV
jgi:hypothetical protein